jgi:hypothetical protein
MKLKIPKQSRRQPQKGKWAMAEPQIPPPPGFIPLTAQIQQLLEDKNRLDDIRAKGAAKTPVELEKEIKGLLWRQVRMMHLCREALRRPGGLGVTKAKAKEFLTIFPLNVIEEFEAIAHQPDYLQWLTNQK